MKRTRVTICLMALALIGAKRPRESKPDVNKLGKAIDQYLAQNVNDVRRLEIVARADVILPTQGAYRWAGDWSNKEWKQTGAISKGYWEPLRLRGWAVGLKYRSTNEYGALVLRERVFCISGNKVFAVILPKDFSPGRPRNRDAATQQFEEILETGGY